MANMTTAEAAKQLGISVDWARKLALVGRLGKKNGRDYVITPADVARYQAKRRKPGRPKKRR